MPATEADALAAGFTAEQIGEYKAAALRQGVELFADGRKLQTHPNGTTLESFPDGPSACAERHCRCCRATETTRRAAFCAQWRSS